MTQVLPPQPEAEALVATSSAYRMEDGATLAPPIPESAHGILAQVGGRCVPLHARRRHGC